MRSKQKKTWSASNPPEAKKCQSILLTPDPGLLLFSGVVVCYSIVEQKTSMWKEVPGWASLLIFIFVLWLLGVRRALIGQCVIILVSHWSGDGGPADRPGGAQEAKPRDIQGDLPHRLQAGPGRQPGGQHREVPHGQTGDQCFSHFFVMIS